MPAIDLHGIICRHDRELRARLSADSSIAALLSQGITDQGLWNSRKRLLRDAYRLSRRTAPMLYGILDQIVELVQPATEFELFVVPDPQLSAWCVMSQDGRTTLLCFTSAAVERLTEGELTFIMGHEIGHVLYRHQNFPARRLVELYPEQLSPVDMLQLMAWSRYAEISADRIGLLVCRDLNIACQAFFRLSSGVTGDRLGFVLEEYLEQLHHTHELSQLAEDDAESWFSTHPFNPLRVKALQLFSFSLPYRHLFAATDGWPLETVEEELWRLGKIMDPAMSRTDTSQLGQHCQEYLVLAGIGVSYADGDTTDSELGAVKSLVSPEFYEASCAKLIQAEMAGKPGARLAELARLLIPQLSLVERAVLLQQLSAVVTSDGQITETELLYIRHLASELRLSEELVHQLLASFATDPGAAM